MSLFLMKILLAEFVAIGTICALEGRWPLVVYWAGASVIQIAVMWGMKWA